MVSDTVTHHCKQFQNIGMSQAPVRTSPELTDHNQACNYVHMLIMILQADLLVLRDHELAELASFIHVRQCLSYEYAYSCSMCTHTLPSNVLHLQHAAGWT